MRFRSFLFVLLLACIFVGCQERAALTTNNVPPPPIILPDDSNALEPYAVLNQMLTAYRVTHAYSDQATIQIIGTQSDPEAPPAIWNCNVAFQRPNKLRLAIYEGELVSDGEHCFSQIQSLPGQVLHFPSPGYWTLEALFQDVHLDAAMKLGRPRLPPSVLRFPPQLILLLANDPLNTFCPRGAEMELLDMHPLGSVQCNVIRINHFDGSRILWISRDTGALLRFEYYPVGLPVPPGFESIESIRIEMTDARFDGVFHPEMFQFTQPGYAERVPMFYADTQGLLTAEEHRHRLKLMSDSDVYRLAESFESSISSQTLPKTVPRTFSISQVWTQSLAGVDTMAFFSALSPTLPSPNLQPKLLIPCEGDVVAVLDFSGNVLQKITPPGLGNAVIMSIRVNTLPETPRIGIITLDSKFHFFNAAFVDNNHVDNSREGITLSSISLSGDGEAIRDFLFFHDGGAELLVLAVQTGDDTGMIRTFDLHGSMLWVHPLNGVPNQLSSATVEGRKCLIVSQTTSHDSLLTFFPDGSLGKSLEIPFGRHIVWFHLSEPTLYTLWENTEMGDIRFLGMDKHGKSQWSRLLPPGEYSVDPVYVLNEGGHVAKWFVPVPSGEIYVFDRIGNMVDTFSLSVVPTGLLCIEIGSEVFLIIAAGETVSAWKVQ